MFDEINKYLLERGFTYDNNHFLRTDEQVAQTMIINGQQHQQKQKVEIDIEYIGDGWIGSSEQDSVPLTEWAVYENGNQCYPWFLVYDLNEFKSILNV